MPAFLESGLPRKGNDQASWTLESAMEQQDPPGRYPFRVDPPVIIKTASTPKMATASSLAERRANAAQLYLALNVVDSAAVRGKIVVVYDDVFTTGATLNAVARRLREAGAHSVYGLTLARAPWR
ncbi:phosphoribosyltransferase family protein [Lentzea sp. NPDC003310]|uniref:ComF family protein n=1 Tax=Lentzea sp. NPDC003310 TaxID=3154447 RepID=UPI0033A3D4E9